MKATKKKPRKYLTHEQLNAMPLHKLLAVGLRDLRKHETTKGCRVNMYGWLWKNDGERTCNACFAGSVLFHSTRKPPIALLRWVLDLTDEVVRWMYALDLLRKGQVSDALAQLKRRRRRWPYVNVPNYENNRTGWWKAMRQLHADLKKAGL